MGGTFWGVLNTPGEPPSTATQIVKRGIMKFTETTKIHDVLNKSKNAVKVFEKYNLDCVGCKGSAEDTIRNVVLNNGLDMEEFLKELNDSI